MSEVTTAAVEATTEVSNEVAAPEVTNVNQVEQVQEQVQEQEQVEEQAQVEEPDYSFVPKKFMKDGKPDWESMAKSYQHMEKKASSKGVLVPEDIAEYEWTPTAQLPMDEEATNAFKAEAQKAGMTKEQYAFAMSKYEEVMTQAGFNVEASAHALQKVWGSDFDENLNYARVGFEHFAPSDLNKNDPIFSHPTVLRLLATVGREMGEDNQSTRGNVSRLSVSKDDITAIMNSPDYWNNAEKRKQVEDWYKRNS